MATMTLICKGYVAHYEANGIRLEIEEPVPSDLLPRIISKKNAAKRLAVSQNHLVKLTKEHGIRPMEGRRLRYRECDLVPLTLPVGEPLPMAPAIVPMPKSPQKPAAAVPRSPATTAATKPPRKTKLHL
jgi:hypothetical protein